LETGAAEVIISVAGGAMIAPKIKRPLFQLKARILSVVSPNELMFIFLLATNPRKILRCWFFKL